MDSLRDDRLPAAAGSDSRRLILETALDAAIIMRADGNVSDWNRGAEEIFGWSAEEAVGQPLSDLIVPPALRSAHNEGLSNYLKTGHGPALNRRFEILALRRNREEFPVELAITPIRVDGQIAFLGFLRDITQRKREERLLARQTRDARILHRAAQLSAETQSFPEALQACLALVCELTGWPVGHAYVPEGTGARLIPSALWHGAADRRFRALREITEATSFPANKGLPGRIWASGEPLWISDVSGDPNFSRAATANLGIASAFGFPVKSGNVIVAVLEFFSEAAASPDEDLLLLVRAVGEQVGRVYERQRGEEARREQTRILATVSRINLSLAAELNLERLMQAVTDAAVDVTGAACGAYFEKSGSDEGDRFDLGAVSPPSAAARAEFTALHDGGSLQPILGASGTVRIDGEDLREGESAAAFCKGAGAMVRSCLSVPVVSRTGAVLGRLVLLGHREAGRFAERHESLISGIAVQAAIGIDNARLFRLAENEIAERKRVEEHQKLLLGELEHRVKNVLAVVSGIASQTARTNNSITAFTEAFLGRLNALARVHSLLMFQNWEAGPLRRVVETALAPYGAIEDGRADIGGPDILLGPKKALAVGMILHELVTNAVKYGGLSAPSGRILARWEWGGADDRRELRLHWWESGVVLPAKPTRRGFGTSMIEASSRYELSGRAEVDYCDDGVRWELAFPLDS